MMNTPKSTYNPQKLARISRCSQFLPNIMKQSPRSNKRLVQKGIYPLGSRNIHTIILPAKSYWMSPESVTQAQLAHIPSLLLFNLKLLFNFSLTTGRKFRIVLKDYFILYIEQLFFILIHSGKLARNKPRVCCVFISIWGIGQNILPTLEAYM